MSVSRPFSQRGRDVGLPTYNSARAALGLPRASTFADVSPDVDVRTALAGLYATVDEIDLYVGGLAEQHSPRAGMGPLFSALVMAQFVALRDGDRFWYEQNSMLSDAELAAIKARTLSAVIRDVTGAPWFPSATMVATLATPVPGNSTVAASTSVALSPALSLSWALKLGGTSPVGWVNESQSTPCDVCSFLQLF
jgi:hypothetical protein